MSKYLLLSHGKLCKTMYETLKLIIGDVSEFKYVLLEENGDLAKYKSDIKKIIDNQDKTIVFTDLFGGSPLISLADIISKSPDVYNHKIKVITGMNLNMLLEASNQDTNDYDIDKIIDSGRRSIMDFISSMERG